LWNFLDGLYPGNSERSVKQLHKLIEREAPEFIFTLIAKLFRDLYWAKIDDKSLPYPSWRAGKLKLQSSKFSPEQLKDIISQLAEIDIKVKTSKAEILSELDLLIIKQLE
jgi:DNA polymerase III delta subunit